MTLINPKIYFLLWEIAQFYIGPGSFIRSLTCGILYLAVFYPFVVLHIKRLRDIRFSYWWTLLTLISGVYILFAVFLCFKGSTKRGSVKKKSKQSGRISRRERSGSRHKIRR